MVWFLAGLVTLFLVVSALNRFAKADRAQRAKSAAMLLVGLLAAFGVLLLVTGKVYAALPALGSAAAGLWRWRWLAKLLAGPAIRKAAEAGAGSSGAKAGTAAGDGAAASTVCTPMLEMQLDEAGAALDGAVLSGQFAGRSVSGLDFGEALALLSELETQDRDGARLLESYLGNAFGADWRERSRHYGYKAGAGRSESGRGTGRGRSGMSREEALQVLGLEAGAGEAEIKAAHRTLIKRLHPDAGGTSYFASKLNEAKSVLLDGLRGR